MVGGDKWKKSKRLWGKSEFIEKRGCRKIKTIRGGVRLRRCDSDLRVGGLGNTVSKRRKSESVEKKQVMKGRSQ